MKKLLATLAILLLCSCGGNATSGADDNVDRCTQTSDTTTNCGGMNFTIYQ